MKRLYVIQLKNSDETLYWSNSEGWIELPEADVFIGTQDEEPLYNLPIEGEWIMLPNIENIIK